MQSELLKYLEQYFRKGDSEQSAKHLSGRRSGAGVDRDGSKERIGCARARQSAVQDRCLVVGLPTSVLAPISARYGLELLANCTYCHILLSSSATPCVYVYSERSLKSTTQKEIFTQLWAGYVAGSCWRGCAWIGMRLAHRS